MPAANAATGIVPTTVASNAMKIGTPYEEVVAEIAGQMAPGCSVVQGSWINGPDGRRDMDVLVEGVIDGRGRRILIECKDHSHHRPVGIQLIDALDSKRRDLAIDVALICSNAGFTRAAVRKAKRVQIGLIGALREGDGRIRFAVSDEVTSGGLKLLLIAWTSSSSGSVWHRHRKTCKLKKFSTMAYL